MNIKRFFKELFNKSLKCQRLGHNMITIDIKIRKRDGSYRAVVTDYKAKQDYCKRCGGNKSEPYGLEEIDWFTSCSMPSNCWDEIRENGYLLLDN